MAIAASMARPARCSLVNVRTAESIDCLFNPPQLLDAVSKLILP